MTDDILIKVRKILAKAEDPAATREEAEIYTAKAAELIASYGIDRALLAQSDPSSDIVGDRVVVMDAPYALDKADLLAGVATKLRCRAVQRTRYQNGAKELSLHLFGYDSDLRRAEVLYTSLLLQATTSLTRTPVPAAESTAAFRRSWLAGFTQAVTRRLGEAEERARRQADARPSPEAAEPAQSLSLVLADRTTAVVSAVAEQYPQLRKAPGRSLSGSGGYAGWNAGQRANLDGSPLRNSPRGQIAG